MNYKEDPVTFLCGRERLLGIVATPDADHRDIGLLILVGGPQYRAGSHRQFTLLARYVASNGFPSFRFDYRGMGDSEGDARPFFSLDDDLKAAVDSFLLKVPSLRSIVIWGLCDAASAALVSVHATPVVRGLILVNPWVHTERGAAQARLKHYYLNRFLHPSFWRKLFTGNIELLISIREITRAARHYFGISKNPRRPSSAKNSARSNLEEGGFIEAMLAGLQHFAGEVLFILSGNDLTAQEFSILITDDRRWARACRNGKIAFHRSPRANHTFSSREMRQEVEERTLSFLDDLYEPTERVA